MKKTVKILALVMVAAMLCCVLASCGNTLKGTYKTDGLFGIGEVKYTFDGDKFTYAYVPGVDALAITLNGTYVIEDNQITLTLSDGSEDSQSISGTHAFEKGDDYIKIGGSTYTLVK